MKRNKNIYDYFAKTKVKCLDRDSDLKNTIDPVNNILETENSTIVKNVDDELEGEKIESDIKNEVSNFSNLDIGLYINKSIDDNTREKLLTTAWSPSAAYKFPKIKDRNLSFQRKWLEKYSWLAYSAFSEGAFCRLCVLFSNDCVGKGGHQCTGRLVSQSFRNYKKAIEKFDDHQKTDYHKRCVTLSDSFLQVAVGSSLNVSKQVNVYRKNQAEENRLKLKSIVKTIIFCGRQGIALRGKIESGEVLSNDSESDGNFRALLRFRVDAGDDMLYDHLSTSSQVSQYISPSIQNELIHFCGDIIKRKIVSNVNNAECFAILADETTDISKLEQMTLCLRYVDKTTFKVKEDFLEFVAVEGLTGHTLATSIIKTLTENGICIEYMVGQGYDGAAAMMSNVKGVQSIVREICPTALYVHCSAHVLNLAISQASKLHGIRFCFGTIKSVGSFFSLSPKRTSILKEYIKADLPQHINKTLLSLCETRWVYKHNAVMRFKELFVAIVHALEKLEDVDNYEVSNQAHQMIHSMLDGQFIISLFILDKILSTTLGISKLVQKVDCDLSEACDHINDIIEVMKKWRSNSDSVFKILFNDATCLSAKVNATISLPRGSVRQLKCSEMTDIIPEEYYRRFVFIPFLDHFIQELQDRFQKHNDILCVLQKFIPRRCSEQLLSLSEQHSCATLYDKFLPNADNINNEFELWKQKWNQVNIDERPNTAISALPACNPILYPNILKLLQILATLPVSTATPERSFSTLKRLKTYL